VLLDNRFTLAVPVDVAWQALQDGERVARCVPGGEQGALKVRFGKVKADYEGAARITEADAAARRLVVTATGRERDAQGEVTATITARLTTSGSGTAVTLRTDLIVTGRLGRFGSGVISDAATQLVAQFADRLAADLAAQPPPVLPPPAEPPVEPREPVAAQRVPSRLPGRLLPGLAVGILAAMAVSDRRLARWALGAAGAAAVTALARQARRATAS
jgi:carbon monoxide dehydrogenase subunit G